MDNVIQFPVKNKQAAAILSKEKIATDVNMIKFNHINETLSTLIPKLFNDMSLAGFDLIPEVDEIDINIKDSAMVVESIRSLLCKYYDIKHPIQQISDSFFVEEEQGVMTIAKNLDLEFETYEKEPADLG